VKRAERNLVLLLSDMKGFTARTSGQTREGNARMLALHDALLLPVVRGYPNADRIAVARADLRDPRASCSARKSAMRRLAVAGGSEAEALLARAAEARAGGSVEARDALRRRQTAKMAER